jgi:AcrR family transcriptional regulator
MAKSIPAKPVRASNRHTPAVRRAMVLESAARLIADEGLMAATMRRIAEESAISLGTLTHHFESVDQLLSEALELASIRFTERLVEPNVKGSGHVRLHALSRAVMPDHPQAVGQWRLWIQFWSRAVYEPALARTNERRYRAWNATVSDLVVAGIKDGSLRPDLDLADVTQNLVAVIDGVCFQMALKGGGMTVKKGAAIIKRFIDALGSKKRGSLR